MEVVRKDRTPNRMAAESGDWECRDQQQAGQEVADATLAPFDGPLYDKDDDPNESGSKGYQGCHLRPGIGPCRESARADKAHGRD